ncbi:hypothetical protein TNCV_17941 [Trichonephila clavipes]|nr:hypothetical protein TNCV_17941 [Trichonephila clavipes]
MREKGGYRLVTCPSYMVNALKLPNHVPRGSDESLQNSTKYTVEPSRPLVLVWPTLLAASPHFDHDRFRAILQHATHFSSPATTRRNGSISFRLAKASQMEIRFIMFLVLIGVAPKYGASF